MSKNRQKERKEKNKKNQNHESNFSCFFFNVEVCNLIFSLQSSVKLRNLFVNDLLFF